LDALLYFVSRPDGDHYPTIRGERTTIDDPQLAQCCAGSRPTAPAGERQQLTAIYDQKIRIVFQWSLPVSCR
jgi:hypothetical protein